MFAMCLPEGVDERRDTAASWLNELPSGLPSCSKHTHDSYKASALTSDPVFCLDTLVSDSSSWRILFSQIVSVTRDNL